MISSRTQIWRGSDTYAQSEHGSQRKGTFDKGVQHCIACRQNLDLALTRHRQSGGRSTWWCSPSRDSWSIFGRSDEGGRGGGYGDDTGPTTKTAATAAESQGNGRNVGRAASSPGRAEASPRRSLSSAGRRRTLSSLRERIHNCDLLYALSGRAIGRLPLLDVAYESITETKMKAPKSLFQEELKKLFSYSPSSGD